jgi:O-methyltransferase
VSVDRAELDRRMGFRPAGRIIHTVEQIALFADAVLDRHPGGVLVEAGAYRGVGTARLSHLAAALDTELWVFDSFQGLPPNAEPHERTIHGRRITGWFRGGRLAATLAEVRATVATHGVPEVVRYRPGWFADTMPDFREPIAGAYLDVDLAASTRTCLDCLWPLLTDRGVIVSQDGHLPLVVAEFRAWLDRADPQPSRVQGLGVEQMIRVDR